MSRKVTISGDNGMTKLPDGHRIEDMRRQSLRTFRLWGRNQQAFLKVIFSILGGMLIGLMAALILRFIGSFNF
jgi:hypothetical protein